MILFCLCFHVEVIGFILIVEGFNNVLKLLFGFFHGSSLTVIQCHGCLIKLVTTFFDVEWRFSVINAIFIRIMVLMYL